MDDQNLPKNIAKEIYKRSVELLRQRQRFEQLLSGVSEAVLAVDQDLKITIFNKAAERMFNVTATEVLGRNIDEVVHLEELSGEGVTSKDFCFTYTSPQVVELNDLVIKTPNGQIARYVTIKSSNIISSDTTKECLVTMTDMTREKLLENLKDEFISVTSHELRTPMTIIKNYLWMMASSRGGQLTAIQKNYVTKAQKGVERMLKLINDMLDVSKIDQNRVELHPTTVDLVKLLTDVVDDFKGKTEEKGLKLEFVTPALCHPVPSVIPCVTRDPGSMDPRFHGDDTLLVRADEDKLREIIVNFLGNAVKFTEHGGIVVSVAPCHPDSSPRHPERSEGSLAYSRATANGLMSAGDRNPASLDSSPTLRVQNDTGGQVKVSVTDTGKGIAPEDLEKLFHKFSRVNNSYTTAAEAGGTGLGLYISKSLVERMGGEVGVTSTEGQGSTFWFTLPIAS